MTAVVAAFPGARPRDAIRTWMVQPRDFKKLAEMRAAHFGGVPTLEPQTWSGAYVEDRLVAAIGWTQEKPDMVMVVEVDREESHWGKVGTIVLIQNFVAAAEARGIRVQAMVLPSNVALKKALEKIGARVVIEIYERVK